MPPTPRREHFAVQMTKESRVERQANGAAVIYNVKINANKSQNKTFYPDSVLETATPLYEGAKVFSNHSDDGGWGWGPRKRESLLGRIRGVTFSPGGHRANFHVLPSAVKAGLVDDVEADAAISGFSHVVWCEMADKLDDDGYEVCKKITKVESVDLVATPATTRGVFEAVKLKERRMAGEEETAIVKLQETRIKERETQLEEAKTALAAKTAEATSLKSAIADLTAKLETATTRAGALEIELRGQKIEAALVGIAPEHAAVLRENIKILPLDAALKVVESVKAAIGSAPKAETKAPKADAKVTTEAKGEIPDAALLGAF